MADYDVGRAFLQIVPSFRGVREQIRAQARQWADDVEKAVEKALPEGFTEGARAAQAQAKKKGADSGEAYGGAFARTVRIRVEAALKALPDVPIDADSSLLDIKLAAIRAELKSLGEAKIGVDLDEGIALAQLERLRTELEQLGTESESLQVRADTATAAASLDKLAAEIRKIAGESPTVRVDADTGDADAKLAATKAESDRLGGSAPSIRPDVDSGRALIGIAVVRAALLALAAAPVVIPIAIGAASLLGPLGAGGAGLLGFAAAAGPAVGRIRDAMKAQDQQATASAGSQASSANQIKQAQLGLADAQRGIATAARQNAAAQVQAAEQVRTAEQSLAQAQRAARQAQEDLTAARRDARRQLQDLANDLIDAQLAERRAQTTLADARKALDAADGNPAATERQRSDAQLAFDEATQALAEQEQRVERLKADKADADKAGVAGAQQVRRAEQALADARQSAGDRQRALEQARRSAADTELANAERTIQAQEQLTRAQLALASAQASAAGSTGKLDDAMAKLSPSERAAMASFRSFGDAYRAWQQALSPAVLPVLTGGLDLVRQLFAPLTPIVLAAAGAFTILEDDAKRALTSPFWRTAMDGFAQLTGPAILGFGHILGDLVTGLAGLALALGPTSGGVLGGVERLADRFATFGKNASKPGGFQDFLAWLRTNLPKAIDIVKSVATAIGRIALALAPIGGFVAGSLGVLADVTSKIPINVLGSIAAGLFAMAAAAKVLAIATGILNAVLDANPFVLIALAVIGLVAAFIYAWKRSETFREFVKSLLVVAQAVALGIWHFFTETIPAAAGHLFDFMKTWGPVALAVLMPFIGIPLLIVQHWGTIKDFFKNLWADIGRYFTIGINGVIGFMNMLISGINWVLRKLHIPEIPKIPTIGGGDQGAGGPGGRGVGSTKAKAFAGGGVVPGHAPGVDSRWAKVSPGESVLVPELTQAIGPRNILAANALFSRGRAPAAGSGGFAGGGLVDNATAGLAGIQDLGGEVVKRGARWVLDHIIPVFANAAGILPGLAGELGSGSIRFLGDQLIKWLDGQTSALATVAAAAAQGAPAGQPVTRWAGVARQALGLLGQPTSLVNPVLQLIKFESGGNPNAVNRTDINWQHGTPSVGLAQVIGPTFKGNAGPYVNTGPFMYGVSTNPLANVYAGLHYGIGRYGSIANIPGIKSVLAGGPYLPYDQGGYLPPGVTTVLNGTGKPEPVFTTAQWATLAGGVRGSDGPMTITGTLDLGDGLVGVVHGIIDQREDHQAQQITSGRRALVG